MSLKTATIPLEDKIDVVDSLIVQLRRHARDGDREAMKMIDALKSIHADLDARRALPTSNALGELKRRLDIVLNSKSQLGYSTNHLNELARHVIHKWPLISQALEQFGEEGVE